MSDSDKKIALGVFIATVILFAFMFRWDVQATDNANHSWKLDRFTGTLWKCGTFAKPECSEVPHAR